MRDYLKSLRDGMVGVCTLLVTFKFGGVPPLDWERILPACGFTACVILLSLFLDYRSRP